jgi:hypothetical protein
VVIEGLRFVQACWAQACWLETGTTSPVM